LTHPRRLKDETQPAASPPGEKTNDWRPPPKRRKVEYRQPPAHAMLDAAWRGTNRPAKV
jgi:hypothetical protein